MNTVESIPDIDRDVFKRAAAEAAVELVTQDMVVGLGSGSTAAFAIELLARRFLGPEITPRRLRTSAQAPPRPR